MVLASANFAWSSCFSIIDVVKWSVLMKLIVGLLVHLLGEWSPLISESIHYLTPSTRPLQNCDENLPSFAVSTLVSFLREHSPNAERFIFPLCITFEPKKMLISVGHPFIHLMGALSGKRGFDTMRVEMTFLWMSEFKSERVVGSISFYIWLTVSQINKLAKEHGLT